VESTASWDRSVRSKAKTMISTSTIPCEKICQMTLKVWMKNMMLLKKTTPNCRGRWLATQLVAQRLLEGEGSTEFEERALAGMACPFPMPNRDLDKQASREGAANTRGGELTTQHCKAEVQVDFSWRRIHISTTKSTS
jgi:hypothetical protein